MEWKEITNQLQEKFGVGTTVSRRWLLNLRKQYIGNKIAIQSAECFMSKQGRMNITLTLTTGEVETYDVDGVKRNDGLTHPCDIFGNTVRLVEDAMRELNITDNKVFTAACRVVDRVLKEQNRH